MFWVALRTSHPAAKAKTIMLLPTDSVEACGKYQFLEEIDEQYRSLCVQKLGTACLYVLNVTKNSTRYLFEEFQLEQPIKEMKG